jgi:hypothetical protein
MPSKIEAAGPGHASKEKEKEKEKESKEREERDEVTLISLENGQPCNFLNIAFLCYFKGSTSYVG